MPNVESHNTEVRTLLEDADLRLRWLPGDSDTVVITFTGIKHGLGNVAADEFTGTASQGLSNKVLFVSDMKRTWYSAPGLMQRIVKEIEQIVAKENVKTILTIGNSMGGYGAILVSRFLPVLRSISFVPQISMDQSLIKEIRWANARRGFGPELVPTLSDVIEGNSTEYYVTYGGASPQDMAHADLLPEDAKNLHLYRLPRCSHGAAMRLKQQGLIGDVVTAMLAGDTAQVETIYEEFARRIGNKPGV